MSNVSPFSLAMAPHQPSRYLTVEHIYTHCRQTWSGISISVNASVVQMSLCLYEDHYYIISQVIALNHSFFCWTQNSMDYRSPVKSENQRMVHREMQIRDRRGSAVPTQGTQLIGWECEGTEVRKDEENVLGFSKSLYLETKTEKFSTSKPS